MTTVLPAPSQFVFASVESVPSMNILLSHGERVGSLSKEPRRYFAGLAVVAGNVVETPDFLPGEHLEGSLHDTGDIPETDRTAKERADRRLVRRVQDSGGAPAFPQGLPAEAEGRKAVRIGRLEGELAERGEVEATDGRLHAVR